MSSLKRRTSKLDKYLWQWPLACLIIMAAAAAGVWGYQQYQQYQWRWATIPMPETTATVSAEMSPEKLGELLQNKHKVRDAATFATAARRIGLAKIMPGIYRLPKTANPTQLAKLFAHAPIYAKVTFPEGWTARQMASRLQTEGVTTAQEFLRLAYPANTAVSPWEGRLFPDTYLVQRDADADDIIQMMHERFAEIIKTLPQPFPQVAWEKGQPPKVLSLEEITTLASLVERETSVSHERPLIAGVLLNRLRRHMRLQCDASVQYAREIAVAQGQLDIGRKERLKFTDLKINSPYNTYLHAGLPPGPICNPGEPSLRAAAHPQSSNYLFYVWSPKQGRHLFATTYDQHLHNIRLIKKMG